MRRLFFGGLLMGVISLSAMQPEKNTDAFMDELVKKWTKVPARVCEAPVRVIESNYNQNGLSEFGCPESFFDPLQEMISGDQDQKPPFTVGNKTYLFMAAVFAATYRILVPVFGLL